MKKKNFVIATLTLLSGSLLGADEPTAYKTQVIEYSAIEAQEDAISESFEVADANEVAASDDEAKKKKEKEKKEKEKEREKEKKEKEKEKEKKEKEREKEKKEKEKKH